MKKILLSLAVLTAISFAGDYEDGLKAMENKDYVLTLKLFTKVANSGDMRGQLALGMIYQGGMGVAKDTKKCVKWYQKAADQGSAVAQSELGSIYGQGKGVKIDKIKSYQLMMKAAKQGDVNAQHNLDILCNKSPWACK